VLKNSLYYAKILLFGEYGIIEDSMGLSIPFGSYKGALTFEEQNDLSNSSLKAFCQFLVNHPAHNFDTYLHLDLFEDDIQRGLSFKSSIPQGFGVGSSGALVAAIYDRYKKDIPDASSPTKEKLVNLKNLLGKMESHFHGKSSGLDPLICYFNLPVLQKSKTEMDMVGLPNTPKENKGAIFLLDSGKPSETQPMIHIFMQKMKEEGFRKMLKTQFKKYNDACIQALLNGNKTPLFYNLKKLSSLLLAHFKPMIPAHLHKIWKKGIETEKYFLKLCGSGGGGFVLGFTTDYEATKVELKDFKLEMVSSL
tara:strand:+ start:25194 stop:26117 length:924 start_codon:yes stop_codon:yes gene_type:complete